MEGASDFGLSSMGFGRSDFFKIYNSHHLTADTISSLVDYYLAKKKRTRKNINWFIV